LLVIVINSNMHHYPSTSRETIFHWRSKYGPKLLAFLAVSKWPIPLSIFAEM